MELKDIITSSISAVVAVFAFITLIKGLIEYRRNTATKRYELFLMMRTRLREDKGFSNICTLLVKDDKQLQDISLYDKDRFLGFFEELAIMLNSGLINDQITLYMFGYYAIRCNKSKNFWLNGGKPMNKEQQLWSLFFDFVKNMEKANSQFTFKRENYNLK